mgnify:CR=1 FL=1
MLLGISSYAYTWSIGVPGYPLPEKKMSPLDLIKMAKELGVEVVQIADNIPLHSFGRKEIENIGKEAKKQGVILELGTRGVIPSILIEYLEIAKLLEAKLLRVLLDSPDSSPTIEQAVEWIRSVLSDFRKEGIFIAIENHDLRTSKELLELVRRIDDPYVGICLDTANSIGALENPYEVIKVLSPFTLCLHLKDVEIYRPKHQQGFVIEGRPLGRGKLNIRWILETVKSFGRDPNVILELWVPFTESIDKTIELERMWIRESVEYAKQLLAVL